MKRRIVSAQVALGLEISNAFRNEPMIAFHDDWSYFANRFRLNIVDYMAARDRAPPKRAKITELTKLIKAKGIKLILAEVNQPERHANKLAQATGAIRNARRWKCKPLV